MVESTAGLICEKLDSTLFVQLSVKFTEQISVRFYAMFYDIFLQMTSLGNELNEIETKKNSSHERYSFDSAYISQLQSNSTQA